MFHKPDRFAFMPHDPPVYNNLDMLTVFVICSFPDYLSMLYSFMGLSIPEPGIAMVNISRSSQCNVTVKANNKSYGWQKFPNRMNIWFYSVENNKYLIVPQSRFTEAIFIFCPCDIENLVIDISMRTPFFVPINMKTFGIFKRIPSLLRL